MASRPVQRIGSIASQARLGDSIIIMSLGSRYTQGQTVMTSWATETEVGI
jgi:hypothetical protein